METAVHDHPDLARLRTRATVLRGHILRMLERAGSGHPGGSLSAVEFITALFFGGLLRYDPERPGWPDRDRFILSKGHGVPALYAALAEAGYFDVAELATLREVDSRLQGHPVFGTAPGVEASTGSLGQGLSIGLGMALAGRLDQADWTTFVLLGDGECQEGQVWEAAMAAGHQKPDNLVALVDYNQYQLDGAIKDIMELEPFAAKWESMGWVVREIDGHDIGAVMDAVTWAKAQDGPACVIGTTVKGMGVSFMAGDNHWHGVAPDADELKRALEELGPEAAPSENGKGTSS